jgi:hypothetical protein
MSTGGIFKLLTNTGIQDKLLTASDYLNVRINAITNRKKKTSKNNGLLDLEESWIPDINEIEKSHVVFINGAFKPYVTSGFEYVKVNHTGAGFGSSVTFTLPQFGDFINDCVVHVKLTGLSSINSDDRVRYVSMLGHRLFKSVEMKINSNPIDSYTSDDYNAFYEFKVPPGKKIGWKRNVGQEIPIEGVLTGDPTYDLTREYRLFGDGNQTLKQKHDSVDLWIPLLFWFKDIKNALPSVHIPFGQTNINIEMANASEIIGFANYSDSPANPSYIPPSIDMELYVNTIYLNPDIVNIFLNKFGFSLIRVHGRFNKQNLNSSGGVKLNTLKWPTETLYVCFKPASNLLLSQHWHKCSKLTLNSFKVPVVARNLKLVTNCTVNVTPAATANTLSLAIVNGPALSLVDGTYENYDLTLTGGSAGSGFISTDILQNRYTVTTSVALNSVLTVTPPWRNGIPNGDVTCALFTPQIAINNAQFYKESPNVDTIEIKAHGISIYQEMVESFYNSYLPFRFGEKMNTPEDRGWYMINFNYLPGEHQPSGHINLSRAREFYIYWKSTTISSSSQGASNLIVLSDAINFLLVKDGSAVLRYST